MTLTEQWDKCKLPEGDYYIKRRNGDFLYDNIDTCGVWRNSIDEDILEVLAPVPSYEEWKELKEASDGLSKLMFKSLMNRFVKADEERERLSEENQHLKELLKEAKDIIEWYKADCCYKDTPTEAILTKINNAIGEIM